MPRGGARWLRGWAGPGLRGGAGSASAVGLRELMRFWLFSSLRLPRLVWLLRPDVERTRSSARVVWKSNKGEARLENELQESNDAIGSGLNCQPVNALVSESKMKLAAVKSLMNCRLCQ